MQASRDLYVVPTDRWYVERTVWLVAGIVLLVSTALAWWVHRLCVLGVLATAAASIAVGLTGWCIVGNILVRLGFWPALAEPGWQPGDGYRMRTDSWYLERRIYVTVGVNLSIGSLLSLIHSPGWLAFTGFVGLAMVWFAVTGFCILANLLYRMGAEPRLVPSARQQRALAGSSPATWPGR